MLKLMDKTILTFLHSKFFIYLDLKDDILFCGTVVPLFCKHLQLFFFSYYIRLVSIQKHLLTRILVFEDV